MSKPIQIQPAHGVEASPRAGFTLFEVAVSLGIVASAVLSVLLIFPVGIKAQQLARFQLYASMKAEEMVESFNTTHNANPALDVEAWNAWDAPVSYAGQSWDLEQRVATHRFGMMPVPTSIAARLDSDDDEIRRILADGGQLLYSAPMATSNLEETFLRAAPPSETQKLVFAVVGYPQNNAVPILAQKNWPYVMPWPSPPMHGLHSDRFLPAGAIDVQTVAAAGLVNPGDLPIRYRWPKDTPEFHGYCWEVTSDPDMAKVFFWKDIDPAPSAGGAVAAFGYFPYGGGRRPEGGDIETFPGGMYPDGSPDKSNPYPGNPASAIRYVQAALWYCKKKLPTDDGSFWNPPAFTPVGSFTTPPPPVAERWKQVQAMRFLSHAASCLSRWHDSATMTSGVDIPQVTLDGEAGPPAFRMTLDHLRYYHERSFNLVMEHASADPYDWNVPRPAQRTIMSDFPLIEYDLFSPPHYGRIYDTNETMGPPAAQWRPITAKPVTVASGRITSFQYPSKDVPNDATFWGDPAHFTLTAPFEPEQRCRQIVCWAVDWMSYEDAELAPSAAVDASRYPFSAPQDGRSFANRMDDLQFFDDHLYTYRNAEKAMLFTQDVSGMASGTDVSGMMVLNTTPDRGSALASRRIFSGLWGADRNFNKRLDRGPVPPSVRLRATLVARFNFYDPRLPAVVR